MYGQPILFHREWITAENKSTAGDSRHVNRQLARGTLGKKITLCFVLRRNPLNLN